jgi:hypothetical protein
MNRFKSRHRLHLPLAGICVILALWAAPAGASYLKDIRIGEYEGFTRIVFELDAPVSSQHINPKESGQLVVTLNKVQPRLIRKIPVERSKHVRSIQFWQRQGHLSTHFQLDYAHFRFEYFPLTGPPRLALDVYPLAAQPKTANTIETRQEESQIREIRESTILPYKEDNRNIAGMDASLTADSIKDAAAVAKIKEGGPPAPEESTPLSNDQVAHDAGNTAHPSEKPPIDTHTQDTGPEPVRKPPSNGLQFYLVIILVAITIGILALLLIMLLSKRRWTDEKNEMDVNEFLKNQDNRIASLNARITEQLRRYKEAG